MTKEFEIDISDWVAKVENNFDAFMLEFCQDLAEEVVTNTPVDTGFLRSSWTVNLNSPDISIHGQDQGGSETSAQSASMNRITANLIGVKGGDVVYYTNNAEYAAYVEFGTSRMQPRHFVRNAITKAPTFAQNAARRVNK